jgi:DNA-binding response OmpR family regulator
LSSLGSLDWIAAPIVVTDHSVETHVKNLRRKLLDAALDTDPIQTVYGAGYKYVLGR